MPTDSDKLTREFVRQWTCHTHSVFAFVISVVPMRADAEEVLQETSTLAWEKFSEFETGTNFTAWACRIAHFKIHELRRLNTRNAFFLSEPLIDAIHEMVERDRNEFDQRKAALPGCLEKLRPQDRNLVELRYFAGATVKSVAADVGRSVSAVYKSLSRIHDALLECVQRNVVIVNER